MTAAKEMGKELYANLEPEERRIKLDAMVMTPNSVTSQGVTSSSVTSQTITPNSVPWKSPPQERDCHRMRSLSEPVSGYISSWHTILHANISDIQFIGCTTGNIDNSVKMQGSNQENSDVSSEHNLDSVTEENQGLERNSLSSSWSDLGLDTVSDSLSDSIVPHHWFYTSLSESCNVNSALEETVVTARCRPVIQADVFTQEYLNLSFN